MGRAERPRSRRESSLSRDQILHAAIDLLDEGGESALTFRALSERLTTGAGAIYHHVADKSDVLTAACDEIVSRMLKLPMVESTPEAAIRLLASSLFDAIAAHPWVGPVLTRAPGPPALVRVLERMGGAIRDLGVPNERQWIAASTLLNYILGVAGQNAANGQLARVHGLDRSRVLDELADRWAGLDPVRYPFTCGIAGAMRTHDDRADFLAGIEIILRGIEAGPQA